MEEPKSTYPLIHNKITAPHYVTPTLRRGRLLDWLHERSDCRALVLAAEAGYGKTTLLWQWEREVDFPCYWYKLDRSDRDWTLHISYIVEAVSQRHPGFGRRAHSVLRQMGGPGSSRPGVTAFLLAEMHERLTEPCTFIIDDWQYVASVTEVRGLWNQILRDAPPTCRFVFASRGKPQLQFARFKTHGGYGELRTDDLRLTESEITELFRDVYRDPLTSDEVSELERRTEGWAASLQLIEVSLRDKTSVGDRQALIESIADTAEGDLFEFLAQEVLDQQTEETRNFLLVTSILQQIIPELAERLAGVRDGTRRLLQLEHSGLFTYRLAEGRYRYHGLFREFLQGRLADQRSPAEVTGLHIHAASYYETALEWPLAIYHYLRANLKRQAARLAAKYGEEVAAEGRLGLVDEWLQHLPDRAIHDNARLSLLRGETLGFRAEWRAALADLERAREFFARKRDNRMEALSLLKQSSIKLLWGRSNDAAALARRGIAAAPPDDRVMRLRLEGNLILCERWLSEPLPDLIEPLTRLVDEAFANGLEHYAAIGLHNLGLLCREIGELSASRAALERAAGYWQQAPSSPFCDNLELVLTLLALGDVRSARKYAEAGVSRTRSWPRSNGEAICGLAAVTIFEGNFRGAEQLLRPVLSREQDLGATSETAAALALEAAILGERPANNIRSAAELLRGRRSDPRLQPTTVSMLTVAQHDSGACTEVCGVGTYEALMDWRRRGAEHAAMSGLVVIASLALDHNRVGNDEVREQLGSAWRLGLLRPLRWWIRRLTRHADRIFQGGDSVQILLALVEADQACWQRIAVRLLANFTASDRVELLAVLVRLADRETADLLRHFTSSDIVEARAQIVERQAPMLYLRGFGPLVAHRGGWQARGITVSKRRLKLLLSLLVAHAGEQLARELVLDTLWPDSDPAAAVNSLNQSIFQLRRLLDPHYRDGSSPNYVTATIEGVGLNPILVRTDLDEFRRRAKAAVQGTPHEYPDRLMSILDYVRGEYLADARYADWAEPIRARVHQEVRQTLLPRLDADDHDSAIRTAQVLLTLDEFDEVAHAATWRHMSATGRRAAALKASEDFIHRFRNEFGEDPTLPTLATASAQQLDK